MQSIDALGEALEAFEGGVVLVSHDARLISTVCADETRSEVWVVDGGEVHFHKGTFEDYRREARRALRARACAHPPRAACSWSRRSSTSWTRTSNE